MNPKLFYWIALMAGAAAIGGCQRQTSVSEPPASAKTSPAPVPPVGGLPVPGPAGAGALPPATTPASAAR